MAGYPNGGPPLGGGGIQSRAPLTVAGATLIAVQAGMQALWSVLGDADPSFPLTGGTENLVTVAVMAFATVVMLVWADRRTTPTAHPILPEGTRVGITNGTGAVKATATVPTVEQANDPNNPGYAGQE